MKKILASHNSASFATPKHWWMRPFNIFSRCQTKSIQEQLDAGVRFFDLRVVMRKGIIYCAHGAMIYDILLDECLYTIRNSGKDVVCQIVIEDTFYKQDTAVVVDAIQSRAELYKVKLSAIIAKKGWKTLVHYGDFAIVSEFKFFHFPEIPIPELYHQFIPFKEFSTDTLDGTFYMYDFI